MIQTKCDKEIKKELIDSNETVNFAEQLPKLPKVINLENESVNNDEQNDSSNDETSAITYETHESKETKRTHKHKWTRLEMEELLYCSSIAIVRKWSSTNGTYEVWRDRNPKLLPNLTPVTLSNMRRTVERRFSSKYKDKILKRAEKEVREFSNKLTELRKSKGKQYTNNKDTDSVGANTVTKNNLSQIDTEVSITAEMSVEQDIQVSSPKRQRDSDMDQDLNRTRKSPTRESQTSKS